MADQTEKKLSRRDAMKMLAAAVGATALAALPSEWDKPALAASELPEHAQQSRQPLNHLNGVATNK